MPTPEKLADDLNQRIAECLSICFYLGNTNTEGLHIPEVSKAGLRSRLEFLRDEINKVLK